MVVPRCPRRRSPVATVIVAAAIAALSIGPLASCTSDGERATTTTTTSTPTAPADLARQACTEVIDERSELVSRRSAEASAELRRIIEASDAPPDRVVADVQDALGAERGQLADAQAILRGVELPASERDDWMVVVDSVAPTLESLDETLQFLRRPDWERIPDDMGSGAPTPDRVALNAALDRLDLLGTDCEWVFDHPGDPTEAAPFHHDAAAACSVVVERRRHDGYDPATASAAEQAAERVATASDLAAVDAGTLDDPAPWERIVAAIDHDTTADPPIDVSGDLRVLGLDQRPCATLTP